MKLTRAFELMGEYSECPKCGSDKIGSGAGSIEITENTFRRTCKCGWEIEIQDGVAGKSTAQRKRARWRGPSFPL